MKFPSKEEVERPLTMEQMKWIEDYFKAHWSKPIVCPVEGHIDWQIGAHLVIPPIWRAETGMSMGGISYPHVMIICKKCGYTMFFNAIWLGLLKQDKGATPKQDG